MTDVGTNGSLPCGWKAEALGEIVDILDSQRVPLNREQRAKRLGEVPYYGATGQVGWIDDHLFDEELVLLGEDGAPFLDPSRPTAYMVRGKSWVNNHAHVLRAKVGILNSFLMYQLNQVDYRSFVSGTTRLKLPQGSMRQIPLLIAPTSEQHRIISAIDEQFTRLDAAVAALKRTQANLKRYRAAVLAAACSGRLVPTEAELAAREGRDYEPADQLLQRILQERRERWEADQLAKMQAQGKALRSDEWKRKYPESTVLNQPHVKDMPTGWTLASLDQLLRHLRNGISTKPNADSGVRILRISAVRPLSVSMQDVRYLSGPPEQYRDYFLDPGDLLFTRYNGNSELVGVCGVVRNVALDTTHPDKLIRGIVASEECLPRYLEIVANVGISREFLAKRVRTTAGQSGVSGGDLKQMPVPLAPYAEQVRIVAEVEARISILDELEMATSNALKRAERLRQSILRRAFEGKLVPQDPSDEPAAVLLERIKAEQLAMPAGTSKKRPKRKQTVGQKQLFDVSEVGESS